MSIIQILPPGDVPKAAAIRRGVDESASFLTIAKRLAARAPFSDLTFRIFNDLLDPGLTSNIFVDILYPRLGGIP